MFQSWINLHWLLKVIMVDLKMVNLVLGRLGGAAKRRDRSKFIFYFRC